MAQATIAADIHQALDVQLNLRAQVTLNDVFVFDELADGFGLGFRPVLRTLVRIDITARENLDSAGTTDSKDGGQGNFAPLLDVKVLSCNSWHGSNDKARNQARGLSLTLFVFRVLFVDHVNAAFPTHDFVVGAAFFDTCTHFHVNQGVSGVRRGAYPFLVLAYSVRIDHCSVHNPFVKLYCSGDLLVAVNNPPFGQVVR
jgi:hypothetical protein